VSAVVSAPLVSADEVSAPPVEPVPAGVSEVQAARELRRMSEVNLRIRIARSVSLWGNMK
jgi:hypothetical protein